MLSCNACIAQLQMHVHAHASLAAHAHPTQHTRPHAAAPVPNTFAAVR